MAIDVLSGDDDDLGFSFANPFMRRRRGGGGRPRAAYGGGGGNYGMAYQPSPPRIPVSLQPLGQGGAQPLQPGIYPVGFPVFLFNLAQALTPITFTINPQVMFRAQRLSCTVIRVGTTAAASAPLLMPGSSVGVKPLVLGADGVPMELFSANSYDTNILFPATTPGTTYSLTLRASSAVTGTDTLTVLVGLLGTAFQ